jgi:uncharacterized protein (UPF0335 family)
MLRWSILAAACVLVPSAAMAQDQVIKDFSATHLEKFITDVMKAEVNKKEIAEENRIVYLTPNLQYDIELRTGAAKCVVFQYPFAQIKASLQKLNDWNSREDAATHAYLNKDGKVVLRATLPTDSGLTARQLSSFYNRIQRERETFEKFAQGMN